MANQEANLGRLFEALNAGTYAPGTSICFAINRPKCREVFAADFHDRVVHHAWYNHVAPRFERAFIQDTCACIKGRGTLYGVRRLEKMVRSITCNWKRPAYYLKCDLRNFFPSIDKNCLFELFDRKFGDGPREQWWLDLTRRILFHDPRPSVDLRGDRRGLALIPPEKSLFGRPAHLGLPIGNLSSQFSANVYLDALDQFVKHKLRARRYIRYVDDFIILHESARQLNTWFAEISRFLRERLGLEVNAAKTIIQPVDRGIDFVGQVIEPHRRTIRKRTRNEALRRIAEMPIEDVHEAGTSYLALARQASRSRRDRALIANAARRRGFAVDHALTKVYPRSV